MPISEFVQVVKELDGDPSFQSAVEFLIGCEADPTRRAILERAAIKRGYSAGDEAHSEPLPSQAALAA